MIAWCTNHVQLMNEIHHRHAAAILLRARAMCGPDDAPDVAQEVLLRLWRHPDGFDPAKGSLRTYLLVLTRGVALDMVRSSARRRRRDERAVLLAAADVSSDRHTFDRVIQQETAVRVNDELSRLDPRQQRAIQRRFFDDMTFGEAARRDAIPEDTVKSRVRLGLQRMRPALSDLHDGGDVQCEVRTLEPRVRGDIDDRSGERRRTVGGSPHVDRTVA
jgi:RNA polymerase sigma-70 factor (ECF subfamily)